MKRYLVFAYDNYYPSGGWNDFRRAFDSLDEARAYAQALYDEYPKDCDNVQVIDSTTQQEVKL